MTEDIFLETGAQIAAMRRFNRFYTRVLGLLDEGLVESKYSLTEARVLFELAKSSQGSALEIAGELSLDAGYLSRILRKFEDAGVLAKAPLAADARHSVLRLTKKGRAAFADLDARAAKQVRELLERLTPERRSTLIASMASIERALLPAEIEAAPLILRPHRIGDMGWVIERHAVLYAEEYGWGGQFEALVAQIAADFLAHFDAQKERCWIADRHGEPLGCVFLVRHPDQEDTAKLRLLLVEPAARGLGAVKALVGECVQFARLAGYKRMTLWTQSILTAAHRIYQQAGFHLKSEEPHHSFGEDLVGQM